MKKKRFSIVFLLCILAGLLVLKSNWYSSAPVNNQAKASNTDTSGNITIQIQKTTNNTQEQVAETQSKSSAPSESTTVKETKSQVSLISVGDIMFHMPEVIACKEGKTYNFKPMFSEVKDTIASKDIAVGNLETTINPSRAISGYPAFNSPVQVLDAIKETGFDVLLTTNNHILDTGIDGVRSTNKLVKEYGLKSIGSAEKNEEKSIVFEKNNIKIGMLAYTYGTNFGTPYADMINYVNKDKIKADIEKIRPKCDYIIVYMHIGTEYVRTPEAYQTEIVKAAAQAGADAILCSHPHVSRKSEVLKIGGKEVYVNYSMGNFISNQSDKYTDIGTMTSLLIEKDGSKTSLKAAETIPVYRLKYNSGSKTVYRTVLFNSVDKYKNLISIQTLAYINQTSKQLAFRYNSTDPIFVQK